jgi:hypothetical protein
MNSMLQFTTTAPADVRKKNRETTQVTKFCVKAAAATDFGTCSFLDDVQHKNLSRLKKNVVI